MEKYLNVSFNDYPDKNNLKTFDCPFNIQIGKFIELIQKNSCNKSFKGKVFIIYESDNKNVNINFNSKNINFNKTLENYGLENNIKINILSSSNFDLHWKIMKYKKGEYNYPPNYINTECPFNLEEIGSQQIIENINEEELCLTNDPPNVIIINVNKHNYAYNKKCLYKWLMINKNKGVTLPINNHTLTKIDIKNIFDICIKVQNEKFSDREPYTLYKINTEIKLDNSITVSSNIQVEETLPNPNLPSSIEYNDLQGIIPTEGNANITPHCICIIS
jgi:hypothetical protein